MRFRFGLMLLLLPLLTACGDEFERTWQANPDTVLLYSMSRSEFIGRSSAFDFINGGSYAVEDQGATGNWDFALADQGNGLVLVPASAFSGLSSRAGIADVGAGVLEDIPRAPSDTSAFKSTPTPVRMGTVYVIRTRRAGCREGFGSGVFYAKMEALEINVAAGTLRFRSISNPWCNDRALIPPN